MDKDKKTKSKILIVLLILITVCCIAITVWAVFFRNNTETVLSPDRAPQKTEENAEEIENDNTEKRQKRVAVQSALPILMKQRLTWIIKQLSCYLPIHQNPRRTW